MIFESTTQLRDEAARRRVTERVEAEVRGAQKQAELPTKQLDALASEGDVAWTRVDTLISAHKPAEYDFATVLLTGLKALPKTRTQIMDFPSSVSIQPRVIVGQHLDEPVVHLPQNEVDLLAFAGFMYLREPYEE